MTDYPFVQGIDYGARKGTYGLSFHMSEGGDGLVGFLMRRPDETVAEWRDRVNGVSCHAAILSNGKIVQMLGWGRACGNLNPNDRSGEYGYYGRHHLLEVLGANWWDPNAYTISVELAGYRSQGPTDAQVAAAIKWGKEMKAMYPSLRGAIGHHDQSPKGCPGTTANMKAIFTGIGGHGLWGSQEVFVPGLTLKDFVYKPGFARVKAGLVGVQAVQIGDLDRYGFVAGTGKPVIGTATLVGDPLGTDAKYNMDRHSVYVIAGPGLEDAVFLKAQCDFEAAPDPSPYSQTQLDEAVKLAREEGVLKGSEMERDRILRMIAG